MHQFAETAESILATRSKLVKIQVLAGYLGGLSNEDLRAAAIFFTGRPFPMFDGRTLNLGGSILVRAIQQISNADSTAIENAYLEVADLGDVAERLQESALRHNEGLMLKDAASVYVPGKRGISWMKWKKALATLDVVVTGVELGHGRRRDVLSDYTFAVQDHGTLRNIGKAYSGLTDAEILEMTEFFKAHTIQQHGRFRLVEPTVVLEVAFNGIQKSPRHNSGFALRFPRILRIRHDKKPEDINSLAEVETIHAKHIGEM